MALPNFKSSEPKPLFDIASLAGASSAVSAGVVPPPLPASDSAALPVMMSEPAREAARSSAPAIKPKSVIGADLKIIGQQLTITSKAPLQIDGQIQGDVRGTEVVIGAQGRVDGSIAAETIIVHGSASGIVRGVNVKLASGSRVEGDVHHMLLGVEQGAVFEGRARRHGERRDLVPDLDQTGEIVPMPRVVGAARR
ncbi:MAG TPA: polymer-forming cytoskeletal protein [Hyphomicrobiaceae bacterium]|nr:polymer-forming cytoskeletal protein [Hyphomicrobiaceae bacterium]